MVYGWCMVRPVIHEIYEIKMLGSFVRKRGKEVDSSNSLISRLKFLTHVPVWRTFSSPSRWIVVVNWFKKFWSRLRFQDEGWRRRWDRDTGVGWNSGMVVTTRMVVCYTVVTRSCLGDGETRHGRKMDRTEKGAPLIIAPHSFYSTFLCPRP